MNEERLQSLHEASSILAKRRNLVTAISASLAAAAGGNAVAQEQQTGETAGALEEVTVTARKREENVQDIPQSIQAFSQAEIEKIGIKSLEDVAKFVPALTVVASSPGLQKIIFRGVADSERPYLADSSAAIYLDEQPLTTGAQSPEIRPIDLERIETLAGPQGTLYGASSQSGTIRYIVAKPDASAFAANVGGGVHMIDHGGTGWDADAMVNIPLIEDKLAIRLVGFGAKDAGYIDNILGYSPGRIDADTGEYIQGSKTNSEYVRNNINYADWYGGRLSAKWFFNEAWALTGIYNYSNGDVRGYNDYDPTQDGDLKTVKFHQELWEDEWSNYQLTLDGDLGFADLTASVAYFERDSAYQFDGTSGVAYYHSVLGVYGRGTCGGNPYYSYYNIYDFATACELNGVGYDVDDGDPTGFNRNDQKDKRWTMETRLSGSTSRWDWTAGVFWQEAKQHWIFGTTIDDYMLTESWYAYNAIYGPLPPTSIRWGSQEQNKRTDFALFGEATFSITDQWKVLLGGRWYDTSMDRTYTLTVPQTAPGEVITQSGSDTGFLPKVALQWFYNDDSQLYVLYSEGYRLGGINRARGEPTLPIQYNPDLLKNWEGGLKSRWLNNRMQLNVIGYHMSWDDMQLELTDPSYAFGEPWQQVIANVGDAVIDGVDVQLDFNILENWSAGFVATYLFKAEIDQDVSVFDERDPDNIALEIPAGTQLPLVSDTRMAAYTEFDWQVDWLGGGEAYLRWQYSYTGDSWNRLVDADDDPDGTGYGGRVQQPSYYLMDMILGYQSDTWQLSAYINNITDERAVILHSTNADLFWGRDNLKVLQPRTFGVSARYYFK